MHNKVLFSSLVLVCLVKFGFDCALGVLSIDEHCDKYPENLRPLLCLLKDNHLVPKNSSSSSTTTTAPRIFHKFKFKPKPTLGWKAPPPPPPPPVHHGWSYYESSSEEVDDNEDCDCCCDVKCVPPSPDDGTSTVCRTCGHTCDVSTTTSPTCSCATFGAGVDTNSTTTPTLCDCTVTCAPNSQWPDEDPYCIYNVTGVNSPNDRRPVQCECCKSKAAKKSDYPSFVCVCQRL